MSFQKATLYKAHVSGFNCDSGCIVQVPSRVGVAILGVPIENAASVAFQGYLHTLASSIKMVVGHSDRIVVASEL